MTYDPEARRDTPLALKLKSRIRHEGPITVEDYMRACLTDPEHGYYVGRPALGRAGDFITAPEISQVFGELIGLWCAVVWRQMGAPGRVSLVELGPGRGTLMRDALRAARTVPPFSQAIDVRLVEMNRHLEVLQRDAMAAAGRPVTWHATLATVPPAASILIANEFLDAAPVAQHVRTGDGWRPRGVGLDTSGRLAFEVLPSAESHGFGHAHATAGSIVETRDDTALLDEMCTRTRTAPTAALFVDYGHAESAVGETLQAVRNHEPEHPLCSPGEADLTVQVDFAAFKRAAEARGLTLDGPVSQGTFLGRLGIVERASRLMAANPSRAGEIEMAVARLIAPQGMGSRFKVLAIRSDGIAVLPGFEGAPDRE